MRKFNKIKQLFDKTCAFEHQMHKNIKCKNIKCKKKHQITYKIEHQMQNIKCIHVKNIDILMFLTWMHLMFYKILHLMFYIWCFAFDVLLFYVIWCFLFYIWCFCIWCFCAFDVENIKCACFVKKLPGGLVTAVWGQK